MMNQYISLFLHYKDPLCFFVSFVGRCGWLKDKYGLSWQVIPTVLGELKNSKEPGNAQRVMQAMFQMNKLDIKTPQEA